MSILHEFEKTSTEAYTKTISFTNRLPTGAAVSSAAVGEAIDLLDGSDASATIVGSPSTTTTSASVPFQNGTDGHTYQVRVDTTLDNSNVLSDVIRVSVVDRPGE